MPTPHILRFAVSHTRCEGVLTILDHHIRCITRVPVRNGGERPGYRPLDTWTKLEKFAIGLRNMTKDDVWHSTFLLMCDSPYTKFEARSPHQVY